MTTPRMLSLAALFVAGTITGAGAVALASSSPSSPPNLVMGQLFRDNYELTSNGALTLAVELFNTGQEDVSVIVGSVAGWPTEGGPGHLLSARAWTQIDISAVPTCDAPAVDVMALDVDGTPLSVPLEPVVLDQVRFILEEHCGSNRYVYLDSEVASAIEDDGRLRMDLRLPGHGRPPIGTLHITEGRSQLRGSVVELAHPPAALPATAPIVVTTYWTIDDCELALPALSEPPVLSFSTVEGFTVQTRSDSRGVAAVARHVAAECGQGALSTN